MNEYRKMLEERMRLLNETISKLQMRLCGDVPEGRVRLDSSSGVPRLYIVDGSSGPNGTYADKKDRDAAIKIIQRRFDDQSLKAAVKEREQLAKLMKTNTFESVYDKSSEGRKTFILPAHITDERFIQDWYDKGMETKGVDPDAPRIFSNRGEQVRSKSEKIIADKLYELGIPYKYENPLMLNGKYLIHPDFKALNVRLRRQYYLEHLGKMDDIDYVRKNIKRIELYEQAGIYPGDRLILLHETNARPLDTRVAEKIIRKFLL